MNETQALQMMADANPIPDAGVYATEVLADRRPNAAVFLTATQERTMTQTLDTQAQKTPQTPKRPWWQPALAAAAVIVLVVAGIAFVTSSSGDDAVTPPEEPVPTTVAEVVEESVGLFPTGTEAAEAWVANANNPDWDEYVAIFSTNLQSDVLTVAATDSHHRTFVAGASEEEARQRYEAMAEIGAEYTLLGDCEEIGPGGYSCPVLVTGGAVDSLTGGELEFDLTIVVGLDGFVQSMASTLGEGAAAQVTFLQWLSENDATLHDEWMAQIFGSNPLERSIVEIVADYRAAQQAYLDQL
ncbi:MAG: hypothetical protein ACR2N9_04220 [Acidimicrobiia bacterium]